MNFVYPGQRPKIPSLCHYSLQWRIQGRGPPPLPPLFLDQTVAVRAEKKTAPLLIRARRAGPPPPPPSLICMSGSATALFMKPMQH